MKRLIRGLIGLAGLFAIWELASRAELVPSHYLRPPSVVLPSLVELLGEETFVRAVVASVLAMVVAVVVAVAIAVPAGLLLGSLPAIRKATMVIIEFVRPIPAVALLPLALFTFGAGPDTKIGLAVFAATWPILFNTMYALDEIDPVQVDTARVFGLRRRAVLTRVALPNVAPFVLTGVRLSSAIALIVVVSTELLAAGTKGIGTFVVEASSGGARMDQVLAATVLVGAIGYLINSGLEALHRGLFGWSTVREAA
ncbi:NitT/TauT family transport system permease protein [Herbihabitans rhizosphaerae]|uniref:NitT/TauT family transport system permease protein n=1 Tax=Herbihabitans rhizosphaerae TaxID=1872711 RepID=A0A4Q7KVJ4_9PSEU|nr:ABC transporter permease subunit [Herbihabitans rhizosphaerae]RZS41058.1 NitT/TauT family transport system permease protein [Herbihabitans rhizosphaerae]